MTTTVNGPAVYVLSTHHGRALYVGASRDPNRRIRQHRAKAWWPEVGAVEVHEMPSWTDALATERRLIRALGPRYNRQSTLPIVVLLEEFFTGAHLDAERGEVRP